MTALFSPITLGPLKLRNRVVIPPMCQYEAPDGLANGWHLLHLGRFATSGAGLMILEATGVQPEGRITDGCLGLYTDAQEAALRDCLDTVRPHAQDMAFGIQLSHAGRKASNYPSWEGRSILPESRRWQTVAPSDLPFSPKLPRPLALDLEGMNEIRCSFVEAARRAERAGFDLVELHAAHGYLLSSFLSPLANQRRDAYGGSLENRMRYPLEVVAAVRDALSPRVALSVRINGTDWAEGGITPEEAAEFARRCESAGMDVVHVSTGGNALVPVPTGTGYQLPMAAAVRAAVSVPVIGVGMIRTGPEAEAALRRGDADLIAVGRAMLNNPHWAWQAAEDLGLELAVHRAYERAATRNGRPAAREVGKRASSA